MSNTDLVRLGKYVMSRRTALGYKHRKDLADELPISDRTLGRLETAEGPADAGTYAILENALHWRPGSIATILDGGEPTEANETRPLVADDGRSINDIVAEIGRLQAELERKLPPDDSKGWRPRDGRPPV